MQIKELLDSVKALRPSSYTDAELIAWLNRIERNIWNNLVGLTNSAIGSVQGERHGSGTSRTD